MSAKKVDLRNLDFNNAGAWPIQVKIAACILLGVLIVGAVWYFIVSDKRLVLEQREQT